MSENGTSTTTTAGDPATTKILFGKHNGTLVADLPVDYVIWLDRRFLKGVLRQAVNRRLEDEGITPTGGPDEPDPYDPEPAAKPVVTSTNEDTTDAILADWLSSIVRTWSRDPDRLDVAMECYDLLRKSMG